MLKLTGQTVAVLGAGRSGQAAARLAAACGAEVTLYDGGEISAGPEGVTLVSGATVETGDSVKADYVVTSPGIETEGDFVQSFARGSGPLWGEIELAWRCYEGRTIAITGTNGKTTTTELIDELVRADGKSCVPCGNYGTPLAEIVLQDEVPEVIALELSSFQLETIEDFKPEVIVFLNFAADHMDRYPSLEEYRQAKMRIFKNADAETLLVVQEGLDFIQSPCRKVTFSAKEEADWGLKSSIIYRKGVAFLDMSQTRLRGLHNAENLMAACASVEGLDAQTAQEALSKYCPPVHRCELVGIIDGVEWLNDSKATNLHALESALSSQIRPTILIAGGKEKGLDYRGLRTLLQEKARMMINFGEIGPSLSSTFADCLACETVATLDEAVALAASRVEAGDTVLFSPGTSSFDQFAGYEARGEAFKKAVSKMTKIL